jgi:hypothetical protein
MRISWGNLEGKNKFTTPEKTICALDALKFTGQIKEKKQKKFRTKKKCNPAFHLIKFCFNF